ncbi:hypothetical protein [Burkholderia pyrrocinia]|uniref:hypothetical protein n=1 Tax=Burkholderia pyrrocinia TaxID=60550 RepID=UPI002AB27199|nr:hypothetical protein [Burkholderia pyrrocinia]
MTEETHKKLNRWLETLERCLRTGALLLGFGLMTPCDRHAVASDTDHADQIQRQVQS